MKPLILIDPGHGGTDSGAIVTPKEPNRAVREADINLKIAKLVGNALLMYGFDVAYTRCNDLQLTLSQRAELSKVYRPALFLSFHCNAASNSKPTGMEVFTSPGRTESDTVAELLIEELEKTTVGKVMRVDLSDGDRDKESKFVVLTQTACPACLLEFGFMTNPADLRWLLSETAWQQIAEAMINALTTWRDDA
ncbi:N-acetylmuramoyl-L-alanine amidase [Desulfuromonas acetoxidans]|uniref:N-acetylmuramoyl-L-alanine amidase n=1 Tax=Desulfuromonas acetoxidans TaxID=891 RepID=UPI002931F4D6|nr:N-acetylmuramoyl-L-alanine amidase [Desulfuromonas acetoxidans]